MEYLTYPNTKLIKHRGEILADVLDDTLRGRTIDSFIPEGVDPSTTDVTAHVQAAFLYCFSNKINLYGSSASTYRVSSTILIPQVFDNSFVRKPIVEFDGMGCRFKVMTDITLFESGYPDGMGGILPYYGRPLDTNYSRGIRFGNFSVEGVDASSRYSAVMLKLQDWHQGCELHSVSSGIYANAMWSNNNYYTKFRDLVCEYAGDYTGDRFVFYGEHNLCELSDMIATNSVVAYKFEGAVTALKLSGLSVEGCTYGIMFNNEVYGLTIEGSYFEHIGLVGVAFTSYVYGAELTGNYFNYANSPNMYGILYPELPATNIYIPMSCVFANMTGEDKIFRNKSANYGQGIVIERPALRHSGPVDLLVDSSLYGPNIEVRRTSFSGTAVARMSNRYIPATYSGKVTDGIGARNGFNFFPQGDGTALLGTAIAHNLSELMYLALGVTDVVGVKPVYGFMIGGTFTHMQGSNTGVSVTLDASTSAVCNIRLNSGATISGVTGEVRVL